MKVNDEMRGKTRVAKFWNVLDLHLIGWDDGKTFSFTSQQFQQHIDLQKEFLKSLKSELF